MLIVFEFSWTLSIKVYESNMKNKESSDKTVSLKKTLFLIPIRFEFSRLSGRRPCENLKTISIICCHVNNPI